MRLLMTLLISLTATSAAHAGVIFLGPTPYFSKADSPFPVDGSNPNFYLEDFEDGELNTPGILNLRFPGQVVSTSSTTNSVDGDDGTIDGLGRNGSSLAQTVRVDLPTGPPRYLFQFEFGFQTDVFGELPTAFGFVWTEGSFGSELSLEVYDEFDNSLGNLQLTQLGDDLYEGIADDHKFIGVVSTVEIGRVLITSNHVGDNPVPFQIDHLQYGFLAVPEPASWLTILGAISVLVVIGRGMKTRPGNSRVR